MSAASADLARRPQHHAPLPAARRRPPRELIAALHAQVAADAIAGLAEQTTREDDW